MMKTIRNAFRFNDIQADDGYTTIEMAVGMLLLLLFSAAVFMLSLSASNTYQALNQEKQLDSDLRIASSYLVTKVRQNDIAGGVSVIHQTAFPEEAIKLTTLYGEEVYETWVYVKDGQLREAMMPAGVPVDDELAFSVVALDAMQVEFDGKGLSIQLTSEDQSRSYYVALQSENTSEVP